MFACTAVTIAMICSSPQHPCSYRINNGNVTDTCVCQIGKCPTDWADRGKVLSIRRPKQPGRQDDILQYMFCDNVIPQQICSNLTAYEKPVQMEYTTGLYDSAKLKVASCRCSETRPMLIKKSYKGSGEDDYHEDLVCPNMNDYCSISPAQPCRHRVYNGPTVDICQCYAGDCSSDWTDSEKVFTFYRPSSSRDTHQYMFCNNVVPERNCTTEDSDKQPVLFTYTNTSYTSAILEATKCRCQQDTRMVLGRRTDVGVGGGFTYKEYFVCEDMLRLCGENEPCSFRRIDNSITSIFRLVTITVTLCRCEGVLSPTAWHDQDQVITLDISSKRSPNTVIHLYMYGRAVLPSTICNTSQPNDEPVKFNFRSSYTLVQYERIRCRCPHGVRMMLKRAYQDGLTNRYVQHFVCPFELDDLQANDRCTSFVDNSLTVDGKCPADKYCSLSNIRDDDLVNKYCLE